MIYLWTNEIGWVQFEVDNLSELEKRGIRIGANVRIGDRAYIGDRVSIGVNVRIGEGTYIGEDTRIGDHAYVGADVCICDRVRIGDSARIGDLAYVGDDACIGNNASPTIVCVCGSAHSIRYWGDERIAIGCQDHSFDEWDKHYRKIAAREDYTDEQIAEYLAYFTAIKSIHSANGNTAHPENYQENEEEVYDED